MPTSSDPAGRHLAIIPARGGSKRLPRKNVIDFFGRPMIAYTLDAARQAGVFDRILVSTEDAEIGAIAEALGAEVDRRPEALGRDDATVVDVCMELLDRLEARDQRFDTLTVLYATAPLRSAEDIRATVLPVNTGRCAFAMAVSEFVQPVHQALRTEGAAMVPVFPDVVGHRADTVGKYYAGNGSTYCVTVEAFRRVRGFYGQPLVGHVMPRERAVDIDTGADLALARFYGAQLGLSEAG